MKYLAYLILSGLMVAINLPAHATILGNTIQITDTSNISKEIGSPSTSSPSPGSDRR